MIKRQLCEPVHILIVAFILEAAETGNLRSVTGDPVNEPREALVKPGTVRDLNKEGRRISGGSPRHYLTTILWLRRL